MMPDPVASTTRLVLDLPPSCMQCCPLNSSYFVVGTYNLEKPSNENEQDASPEDGEDINEGAGSITRQPQSRNGSLVLFQLDGDNLTKLETKLQPSAVLDLRFHPNYAGNQSILAVVSSTGTLTIFSLDPSRTPALQLLETSRCGDLGEEVLFLQCNWHPSIENVIAITTSTGLARLLHLDNNWSIRKWTDLDIGNTLEAWSINFANGDSRASESGQPTTAYCGGDDSMLRYTSCSFTNIADQQQVDTPYAGISLKGQHDAGVTAILPLSCWTSDDGRVVLTGSYDDHLRVFSICDLHETFGAKKVQLLSEINLGGGVWRLNLIDIRSESPNDASTSIRVLASCMHAGARIVEVATEDGTTWKCSVLARFEEHKSMNYASDFVPQDDGFGIMCVSTSFYDKLLSLWKFSPPA